ncbi:hypothetical protein A6D6_01237 [Alcanivorax xiamenensis]|uniref:DUF3108 domain-containing protein n=1 Tax=Alcanivorax xiamenensis TaxID=1177156 RepID=A0ABQ6YAJ7_9GAMM|nr:DUF3108 domain-containing protein [Alcanivorax xiamenensis]KAF0806873.1 hypothetical protein A6D6_01237 [Alcanivorax xiamenensis]
MAKSYPHKAGNGRRRFLTSALLTLLILATAPAIATESPITPFQLQYRLKAQGIPFAVTANRTLKALGDGQWQMEVVASNVLGEIRETSRFTWSGCTPVSRYYGYRRKGLGQLKEAEVRIPAGGATATAKRSGKADRQYPVPSDAVTDKISLTLALQCRLARGERDLTLHVADERELESQHYLVEGEETLSINGNPITTVKVRRDRSGNSPRQTWLWFAPEYGYTLVQLVQENEDGRHVMTLQGALP